MIVTDFIIDISKVSDGDSMDTDDLVNPLADMLKNKINNLKQTLPNPDRVTIEVTVIIEED